MRVLRRVALLGLAVLVVVVLVLVFTSRPDLEDAKKAVDASWNATLEPLDARYTLLGQANAPLRDRPGPASQLAQEVDESLDDWVDARGAEDRAAAISAANDLEGLGRRLVLIVNTSPTLSADPAAKGPADAFAAAALPAELTTFTEAVQTYEESRQGPVRSVVADMFGYDQMSTVAVPAPAPT